MIGFMSFILKENTRERPPPKKSRKKKKGGDQILTEKATQNEKTEKNSIYLGTWSPRRCNSAKMALPLLARRKRVCPQTLSS